MTDEEFCKIDTAISGEQIDSVDQVTRCSFTGRELKEYVEQALEMHGVGSSEKLISYPKEEDFPIMKKLGFAPFESIKYNKTHVGNVVSDRYKIEVWVMITTFQVWFFEIHDDYGHTYNMRATDGNLKDYYPIAELIAGGIITVKEKR